MHVELHDTNGRIDVEDLTPSGKYQAIFLLRLVANRLEGIKDDEDKDEDDDV